MRVASNKLKDMISFYYSELDGVYAKEETEALVSLAVEHYLGYSRTDMITKANDNINQSALIKLYDCCRGLKNNMPLQYILGEAWFYKLKFYVNASVLIPRPETEELVSMILQENPGPLSYFDIGTGSGCIPISIKKNSSLSKVTACDISSAALNTAWQNAKANGVDITFFETDILQADPVSKKTKDTFDVIISNPPYIKSYEKTTLAENVIGHEPHLALFVEGDDNIIFYKKIIDLCAMALNKNGKLYFELNPMTANDVKNYALASQLFAKAELIKDMSGNLRFFKATKF